MCAEVGGTGCATVGAQVLLRRVRRLAVRRLRRWRSRISLIVETHSWIVFNISFRSFDWVFGGMVRVMKAPMIEHQKLQLPMKYYTLRTKCFLGQIVMLG